MERTWAGTHTFAAEAIHEARSVAEVQELVASHPRVRALGTRHSFNDLADGPGILVSTTAIDPDIELDEAGRTVTVGGGTRYGVLAEWLEARGWALHNMGSLPHISVAGATATSTHGSGNTNGSLATAVSGLEFVTATGELLRVRRGDPDFDGMVVHLGALGIVTRVTLDLQPSYLVRQDVYDELPWEALLSDFEAVSSAGYSVSVFMDWLGPTARSVWVKSRMDAGRDIPDSLLGAVRDLGSKGVLDPVDDNVTQQGGVPGPWSLRLPHFRLDRTPSNGDEIQTEYFVARADAAAALAALRELRDRIAPHLLITELRTVAADDLWLSPAYGRDSLAIHFTWKNQPDAVDALLDPIEAALAPFAPRPHWGKVTHVVDAAAPVRARGGLPGARGAAGPGGEVPQRVPGASGALTIRAQTGAMTTPTLQLNNGVAMPAIGYGVFQTPPDETTDAVAAALETGYRHIDTAAAYGNEVGVGEGIRRSGVPRDDLFIETKVWVSDYGYDETLHAFEKATGKLGVDRLDLLILHQPAPDRFEKTIAAYRALEKLLANGSVRAIGVSNFMRHHLELLESGTEVVPAVNQIEVHPYFAQPDVQAADRERGILTQAWSPIGGIIVLPGLERGQGEPAGGCHDRRDRGGARQDRRAGHASLASATGTLGDPEVGDALPHRGELRRAGLRTECR